MMHGRGLIDLEALPPPEPERGIAKQLISGNHRSSVGSDFIRSLLRTVSNNTTAAQSVGAR